MAKLAVVKKRTRGTSLDAQIKREAKKIYESGMAEAMNAAIGKIVCQKLDEVRTLLAATGYKVNLGVPASSVVASPVQPPTPSVLNPCCMCGREGVYRAKKNRFTIGNPPWYCRDHQVIAAQTVAEDRADAVLLGAQAPAITQPTIAPAPPAQMVPQQAAPVDAMAEAMGLAAIEPQDA